MTAPRRGLTRRAALASAAATATLTALTPWAWAAGRQGLHGLSIFGDLKYPPGFRNFDYLNAQAPKGGRINFLPSDWVYNQAPNTFDTLNSFVLKGSAPPRMELCFDTLMARANDEPSAMYGLLAETVDVSDDAATFTFHLRQGPRFRDGTALTAEDVAFSLKLLKEQGHPQIAEVLRSMQDAVADDARTVTIALNERRTRETILTIAGLPIFSKAFYTANTFDASTLTPPLASGPYTVGRFEPGRTIEYERARDYWGADLPVNVGSANFDTIRIEFFQEREAAFQAFQKGEITWREEFTAKTWALEYGFPAVTQGRVKKTLFAAEQQPVLQGWFFNTRLKKFADPRTRLAIGLAFDFEWSNTNLFYGSYAREFSFFQNSDFMAEGTPGPDELKLLEPYRADLPEAVFGEAYVPPKTDGSGRDRTILKQAVDLLAAAGWTQAGGRLVDADGNPLTVEFLIDASVFERVLAPYSQNLRAIGVEPTIRQVDPVQYDKRLDDFDFDVILVALRFEATPLEGMTELFGSRAADTPGTHNYAGIKSKAVDGLLGQLPKVETRAELETLLKALDRVLRAGQYWTPSWYLANHRVAHWDLFGWPATKPDYDFSPETTWWFDRDRAEKIGMAG